MYICSGLYKGRKLVYSNKLSLRPSLARVRKMVMDTLMPIIFEDPMESLTILDAFAGTGAYGFEALSIFGGHCTFLELDKHLINNMKETISNIKIMDKTQVILGNSLITISSLHNKYFNLIFIDPPYDKTFLIRKFLNKLIVNGNIDENSYVVVENSIHNRWDFIPDAFDIIKEKKAASTKFLIIKLNKNYMDNNSYSNDENI